MGPERYGIVRPTSPRRRIRSLETQRPAGGGSSDNDEVKPFHAKTTATGQEAADAVAAVLKHAQERDQKAKEKVVAKAPARWMLPLGVNLGVLAGYLLIFSPPWLELNPLDPPPLESQVEGLRTAMYFELVKIETFRVQQERLPNTLEEAGAGTRVPGLSYTVRGEEYVLLSSLGDQAVVFDSSVDDPQTWAGNLAAKIGG